MSTLNKIRSALAGAKGLRSRGDDASPPPGLRRLRIATTVFFALDGFLFAGWVVRIPAVKEQTGASPSALGLALLGVSAGGVVTMMLTGRLCRRYGNHSVTVVAAALLSLGVALPPLTHSAVSLGLVLLVFGAAYGGLNVAMNAAAVDLIAALGRPVMPGFHAAFSLGGMAGAGLGGLVAGQLSATRHLLLLTAAGLILTALAGRVLLSHPVPAPARFAEGARPVSPSAPSGDSPAAEQAPQAPKSARRARRLVLVLGLVALCTAYGEGALADWSALHLTEDLHAGPGTAAAGYSLFALAMTAGRLCGTALLERLGQSRLLTTGGLTAGAGMLLASVAPEIWLVLVGFVITGLGLANLFPVAVARAGALTGPGGVAAASTLGYGGMLVGPVAIGFLAEWFSLTAALTTVALLAFVAAAVGRLVRGALADGG
ncbi:MFS transporter [Streptomyces marispadix]|uniref:MFS transporter n=1 Tax=Streptomyces marispadix TaxID=2922868 RepID=A0ABS9SS17_9ACTN|nr:MFS transporter [Streptomyces marispadix]MCH6159072.1 MFS transporter [Streptomyces marispadix]